MKFQEKLHQYTKEEIWEEYCGFLNLTPDEFMKIQERLLLEQIECWSNSALGQSILKGKKPTTIAMYKFKEGKLSMIEKASNDVTEEAIAASAAAESENVAENAAANAEAADAAFGV